MITALMVLALLAPEWVLSITHPGLWLRSDGGMKVMREDDGRTCGAVRVFTLADMNKPDLFCGPPVVGVALLCTGNKELEIDFHWWLVEDEKCTHSIETWTESEIRKGVKMHGELFYWEVGDMPEEIEL